MSMGIGLGLGLPHVGRAGGAPAYQRILDAVSAVDAAASVYDPDNPNTWTLREDGGTQYYASIEDGLGNRVAMTQATEADQPPQITLSTGRRVMDNTLDTRGLAADFTSSIAQPNTVVVVGRNTSHDDTERSFIDGASSGGVSGGRQILGRHDSNRGMWASNWIDATEADASWHFQHGNYDGASSELFVDGSSDATGDAGTNSLGGVSTRTATVEDVEVGLIITFSGKKTNAELADLRAVIADLYPLGDAE